MTKMKTINTEKINNSLLTFEEVKSLGWIQEEANYGTIYVMPGTESQGMWKLNVNWRAHIFCSNSGEPASFTGHIQDAYSLGIIMISLGIPNAKAHLRNLQIKEII